MTTWNTKCGIAEYSRYLYNALSKRDDIFTIVLGSQNYDDYDLVPHEEYVYPCFEVQPWNQHGYHGLLVDQILDLDLDVLHVEYEVMLYNQPLLTELLHRFEGPKVITFHDNCIPYDFDFNLFDLRLAHRDTIGVNLDKVYPFGIENIKPVVKTFGLGRSRWDVIQDVCQVHNWTFEKSFGTDGWKTQEELHAWLRDSDVIVLYYDEVPSAGSSQAARTAIATRRPVVVNNTTWFKDVPTYAQNIHKVEDSRELESVLIKLLSNPYIYDCSWDIIAEGHVKDYQRLLSEVTNNRT